MSTYAPAEGIYIGRPPCSTCGANFHLHEGAERHGSHLPSLTCLECQRVGPPPCPTAYRPSRLEEAQRALAEAERSGDSNRVFVARGEVQRLAGRRS